MAETIEKQTQEHSQQASQSDLFDKGMLIGNKFGEPHSEITAGDYAGETTTNVFKDAASSLVIKAIRQEVYGETDEESAYPSIFNYRVEVYYKSKQVFEAHDYGDGHKVTHYTPGPWETQVDALSKPILDARAEEKKAQEQKAAQVKAAVQQTVKQETKPPHSNRIRKFLHLGH